MRVNLEKKIGYDSPDLRVKRYDILTPNSGMNVLEYIELLNAMLDLYYSLESSEFFDKTQQIQKDYGVNFEQFITNELRKAKNASKQSQLAILIWEKKDGRYYSYWVESEQTIKI